MAAHYCLESWPSKCSTPPTRSWVIGGTHLWPRPPTLGQDRNSSVWKQLVEHSGALPSWPISTVVKESNLSRNWVSQINAANLKVLLMKTPSSSWMGRWAVYRLLRRFASSSSSIPSSVSLSIKPYALSSFCSNPTSKFRGLRPLSYIPSSSAAALAVELDYESHCPGENFAEEIQPGVDGEAVANIPVKAFFLATRFVLYFLLNEDLFSCILVVDILGLGVFSLMWNWLKLCSSCN